MPNPVFKLAVCITVTLTATASPSAQVESSSTVTTVAGSSQKGYGGDNGPAVGAIFDFDVPTGFYRSQVLAIDSAMNLYLADTGNNRVRRIAANGAISTVAGTGAAGFYGDGGPAAQAVLYQPMSVAIDSNDGIYIADTKNGRIRRIGSDGSINTMAGGGSKSATLIPPRGQTLFGSYRAIDVDLQNIELLSFSRANDLLLEASAGGFVVSPNGTIWKACCPGAFDLAGNLYVVSNGRVYRNGVPFAGTEVSGYAGDGGPALAAQFGLPQVVAVDPAGDVYVADNAYCTLLLMECTCDVRVTKERGRPVEFRRRRFPAKCCPAVRL